MCDTQHVPRCIPPLEQLLRRREELTPSPRTPPNANDSRMHIHIDLSDSNYLSADSRPHTNTMQINPALGDVTCSSGPPPTVAYTTADLAPYNPVCYSVCAHCLG